MTQRSGRQHATPIHIDRIDESGTATALERLGLTRSAQGAPGSGVPGPEQKSHSESWLQQLIFRYPQTLPAREIEPGFGTLVPVCLELPTPAGYVDGLYVTENGDLALVECKLWRNPEARREVVAQIIDYAHSLSLWTYEDLERGIGRAQGLGGSKPTTTLYGFVAEATGLSEEEFVDAVARNLRLGRFLLMIVGDGIREGVESLNDYLQRHAGFHFVLALVEMTVWQLPQGGYLVLPRVLARTVNIERGIVRLIDGRIQVADPTAKVDTPAVGTSTSPSQDRLLEAIARIDPAAPDAIRQFAAEAADRGVALEPTQKSLMVRWQDPEERAFALGGFNAKGQFITYSVNWVPDSLGKIELAHRYLEELATLVGGTVQRTKNPAQWYVAKGGTLPGIMDILARKDAWLALIDRYASSLLKGTADGQA